MQDSRCIKKDCENPPTKTLYIEILPQDDEGVPIQDAIGIAKGYLGIVACDQHEMPSADIEKFLDMNWKQIAFGFTSKGFREPSRKKTVWKWVPIQDAIDFWNARAKKSKPIVN